MTEQDLIDYQATHGEAPEEIMEIRAENKELGAQWERGFAAGTICALLVLINDGADSYVEEILKGVDLALIERVARWDGDDKIVDAIGNYRRTRQIR